MNYWIIPLIKDRRNVNVEKIAASYESEEILYTVATYYNLTVEIICQKGRYRNICLARQVAMFLMRRHTKLSYKGISSRFGGRDHTTAIHACNTIEDLMCTDENLVDDIKKIKNILSLSNII